MDLSEIENLIDLCRRKNVQYIKTPQCELVLAPESSVQETDGLPSQVSEDLDKTTDSLLNNPFLWRGKARPEL